MAWSGASCASRSRKTEGTTRPILELTEEQVIDLIRQMSDEQRKRVLDALAQPSPPRPRPQFGSAKGLITIADDFDEPLGDFKEYME